MNEPTPVHEITVKKPWYRQELFFFLLASIISAFFLVVMSLALYVSSGASLLDLSRPGYQSVQSKVEQADNFEAFSSDGAVTKSTLDQFQQLYQKQVKSVSNSVDFDSTPLGDQTLGIDDPQSATTE